MNFDKTFTSLDCLIAQIEHCDLITCEGYVYPGVVKVKFTKKVKSTCSSEFDKDSKPCNAVQLIIDEEFLDGCMNATSAHTHSSR